MHKDSWRKRVNRAYHGVFKRWKKKVSDETRILKGATTLKKELEGKLDKNISESLKRVNRGELSFSLLISIID